MRKVDFCSYVYYIDQDISFCSQYYLTPAQVSFIENQFLYSIYLYKRWEKRPGETPDQITHHPSIYLINFDVLNDCTVLKREDCSKKIASWYVYELAHIYITERVFEHEGRTDFPHEVVHWLNEMVGVDNAIQDEKLADDFEPYYERECKGCK
jgi:hypothetical protein